MALLASGKDPANSGWFENYESPQCWFINISRLEMSVRLDVDVDVDEEEDVSVRMQGETREAEGEW